VRKIICRALICFAAINLIGCASLDTLQPLASNETVDTSKGYLYGRLALVPAQSTNLANNWIVLENTSTQKQRLLKFNREETTVAVAVNPGEYRIAEFLHTKGGPTAMLIEDDLTPMPIPENLSYLTQPFVVKAGTLNYLGDYYSNSDTDSIRLKSVINGQFAFKARYSFGVNRIEDGFESTTKEMLQKFPKLSTLTNVKIFEHPANTRIEQESIESTVKSP